MPLSFTSPRETEPLDGPAEMCVGSSEPKAELFQVSAFRDFQFPEILVYFKLTVETSG